MAAAVADPAPPQAALGKEDAVREQLKAVFRKWDEDGNGWISKNEMKAVMVKLLPNSQNLTTAELEQCMEEADKNQNGRIEYDEFVDWLLRPGSKVSRSRDGNVRAFDLAACLRPLYDVYDRNRDGNVSMEEFLECHCILQNSLQLAPAKGSQKASKPKAEPTIMEKDADRLFKEIDRDRGGYVSFEEFVDWQRKALSESGLLSEDLLDLVPALARQLARVFRLSDSDARGELESSDERVLQKIIENLAMFTRDLWNTEKTAQSSVKGKQHYANRWVEPPIGLNIERLKGLHLKRVPLNMLKVDRVDIAVLCLPEFRGSEDELVTTMQLKAEVARDNSAYVDETREWLAEVVQKVTYKDGQVARMKPQYYIYHRLQWVHRGESEEIADEFKCAKDNMAPEIRVFCQLKCEANFGVKITWDQIQTALNEAVRQGCLTSEQHMAYNNKMEEVMLRTIREEGLECRGEAARQAAMQKLRSSLSVAPRNVMATFSELGIFKVSSVWVDFMDS